MSEEISNGPTGRPQLCAGQCATCIGRPGNLMDLRPGRLRGMVNGALQSGGLIICHETLSYGQNPERGRAACRWFYEQFGHLSNIIRITERLGGFDEIELPAGDEEDQEQEAG
jgi:hypothetical protein